MPVIYNSRAQNCWRDSARVVRIGFLDARACSGLFVWMLHMSWPTFWLSCAVMLVFVLLERGGISLPAALRLARTYFAPEVRLPSSPYPERRRLQ